MKNTKFIFALVAVIAIVAGLTFNTVDAYAARKDTGGDPIEAQCLYWKSIIDYPYTSSYILVYALSFYNSLDCDTVLEN